MNSSILTVSQLNRYVDSLLYSDSFLKSIAVKGEVVDINRKYDCIFLTLKDESSSLDCMIADPSTVANVDDLEKGRVIVASGSVGLYQKSGRYRMRISEFRIYGEGEYYIELERLKKKLAQEGLFDPEHKTKLPEYPRHIGLITSSSGAVMHDIHNVALRRDPSVRLSLFPVKVQGADAPGEIISAIDYYERQNDVDVIIICRGGGALVDLAPFNSENLARRIYSAHIPIVSAVGHEINFSICDFVSDLRAPTPSAAADMVIHSRDDIIKDIEDERAEALALLERKIQDAQDVIDAFDSIRYDDILSSSVSRHADFLNAYESYISQRVYALYESKSSEIESLEKQLELLNPYSSLERGYVLVKRSDEHIASSKLLKHGDSITLIFSDGSVGATVTEDNNYERK